MFHAWVLEFSVWLTFGIWALLTSCPWAKRGWQWPIASTVSDLLGTLAGSWTEVESSRLKLLFVLNVSITVADSPFSPIFFLDIEIIGRDSSKIQGKILSIIQDLPQRCINLSISYCETKEEIFQWLISFPQRYFSTFINLNNSFYFSTFL